MENNTNFFPIKGIDDLSLFIMSKTGREGRAAMACTSKELERKVDRCILERRTGVLRGEVTQVLKKMAKLDHTIEGKTITLIEESFKNSILPLEADLCGLVVSSRQAAKIHNKTDDLNKKIIGLAESHIHADAEKHEIWFLSYLLVSSSHVFDPNLIRKCLKVLYLGLQLNDADGTYPSLAVLEALQVIAPRLVGAELSDMADRVQPLTKQRDYYGNSKLRSAAIKTLGAIAPSLPDEKMKEIVTWLIKLRESYEVQRAATKALRTILQSLPKKRAAEIANHILQLTELEKKLRDPTVSQETIENLQMIVPHLHNQQIDGIRHQLIELLKKDTDICQAAIQCLAVIVPQLQNKQIDDTRHRLIELLKNKNKNVCQAAIQGLVVIAPYLQADEQLEKIASALIKLLKKDTDICQAAIQGLAMVVPCLSEQRRTVVIKKFILPLSNGSEMGFKTMKRDLRRSLSPHMPEEWITPFVIRLESVLNKEAERFRVVALEILGKIRLHLLKGQAVEAIDRLILLLSDKNYEIRSLAAKVLGMMFPHISQDSDRAAKATDGLIQLLSDENHEVRLAVASALGAMFPHIAKKDKERAAKATDGLIQLLSDENHEVRLAVVKALGAIAPYMSKVKAADAEKRVFKTFVVGTKEDAAYQWIVNLNYFGFHVPDLQLELESNKETNIKSWFQMIEWRLIQELKTAETLKKSFIIAWKLIAPSLPKMRVTTIVKQIVSDLWEGDFTITRDNCEHFSIIFSILSPCLQLPDEDIEEINERLILLLDANRSEHGVASIIFQGIAPLLSNEQLKKFANPLIALMKHSGPTLPIALPKVERWPSSLAPRNYKHVLQASMCIVSRMPEDEISAEIVKEWLLLLEDRVHAVGDSVVEEELGKCLCNFIKKNNNIGTIVATSEKLPFENSPNLVAHLIISKNISPKDVTNKTLKIFSQLHRVWLWSTNQQGFSSQGNLSTKTQFEMVD